jgi:hypothetical protein
VSLPVIQISPSRTHTHTRTRTRSPPAAGRQPLNRPSLTAWRLAPVRHPHSKAFDTSGRTRDLRVFDARIFGVILKQGTGSTGKVGLVVHDLAGVGAPELGLLFATDAKARVGGFLLPLHIACFVAKGSCSVK